MTTVWVIACASVLLLIGMWVRERLPQWQAADARAHRVPLRAEPFGNKFFTPDQARIAARLREIAAEQLDKDLTRLDPDDSLAETLFDASDSLDSVELLIAIEEEFGIELAEATLVKIATFRDLVNAVVARQPFLVKWRREIGQAVEERFGISLAREVLAGVATPLEVAEAVAAELKGQVGAAQSCQTQRAFHLLRNAMTRVLRVPRRDIKPSTPLRRLVRWRTTPVAGAQLREAVGARQWPTLVQPRWMVWSVRLLPLLAGLAVVWGLPAVAESKFLRGGMLNVIGLFLSELRGIIVIPLIIALWVLLSRVSRRFRRKLPRCIRTVSDLLPFVATSPQMTWTRNQIEQAVQDGITQQLQLPLECFRVDGRFVEDFGLAGG